MYIKNIPPIIKLRILKLWLLGVPRDMIAVTVGIGTGSVSRIIKEIIASDVPDLDLFRVIAKRLREHQLDINQFVERVRLSENLLYLGISLEEVENLLEQASIHCFKSEKEIDKFIRDILAVCNLASMLGVSVPELAEFINRKYLGGGFRI